MCGVTSEMIALTITLECCDLEVCVYQLNGESMICILWQWVVGIFVIPSECPTREVLSCVFSEALLVHGSIGSLI